MSNVGYSQMASICGIFHCLSSKI